MGSSRDGAFTRWEFRRSACSLREEEFRRWRVYEVWSSADRMFRRWGVEEIVRTGDGEFSR